MTAALTRRAVLAASGAAALAAPAAAAVLPPAGGPAARLAAPLPVLPADMPLGALPALAAIEPDAELIRACAAYIAAARDYDQRGGHLEPEERPWFPAYEAAEVAAKAIEPQTLAGVLAMAEVAAYFARQRDGSENWSDSHTGDWPERIAKALKRLLTVHRAEGEP